MVQHNQNTLNWEDVQKKQLYGLDFIFFWEFPFWKNPNSKSQLQKNKNTSHEFICTRICIYGSKLVL